MKLYLIRHAHSIGNELNVADSIAPEFDLGLSKKGKKQAKELIPTLASYKFGIYIISPLTRTRDTLKPHLKTIVRPKILVNNLTLERNIGELTGKKLDVVREYYIANNITDKISFRPKGGESLIDTYKRAKKFLLYLKKTFKNESILICGHKRFLTCLEIAITKKNIMDFYSQKELSNGEIRAFKI